MDSYSARRTERSRFAQGDEFGMAQKTACCAFGESYFGFDFGAEPGVMAIFSS
jgi:hypothetical protein